jgi:hypothetical protein
LIWQEGAVKHLRRNKGLEMSFEKTKCSSFERTLRNYRHISQFRPITTLDELYLLFYLYATATTTTTTATTATASAPATTAVIISATIVASAQTAAPVSALAFAFAFTSAPNSAFADSIRHSPLLVLHNLMRQETTT